MPRSESGVPVIILAAGQSVRMGTPKQLLPYGRTHLLGHTILNAAKAGFSTVHVVLGCHAEQISSALCGLPAHAVINQEWREGMASSIRCGLASVLDASPGCDAVLLMLCDQPMLGASHLRQLHDAWRKNPNTLAAASTHLEVLGAPAIIGRSLFPWLRQLSGSAGARRVLERHRAQIITLEAPGMLMDIDTPDDYRQIQTPRQ